MGPLLTNTIAAALDAARRDARATLRCSLDLQRSESNIEIGADAWGWNGTRYPYPGPLKDRTIYHWDGAAFSAVARFATSLIKLVPTSWGAPTFEIDGIKMLPTATVSPYLDAQHKVGLIEPRGKVILDCCGGLGYFAAWSLAMQAARVMSFEKNPEVLWLRSLNPWSPPAHPALSLRQADITEVIPSLADDSVDAVLHDPPRFGIAGELYSQSFYHALARVLRRRGRLFHYTGAPNKRSRGRQLADEVSQRLKIAGFKVEAEGDGLLAVKP
jgi:predicted methyltransferase